MSNLTKRICFSLCAVFSFYLYKSSLDYFVVEQAWHEVVKKGYFDAPIEDEKKNAFYQAKSQKIIYQTNSYKANQSVWRSDRQKYFSRAEKALKTYLSYYPSDGSYWLKLLALQYSLYGYSDKINWAIAQNIKWNRWNKKYMLNISFHCVQNWQILTTELQDECIASIRKISNNQYYNVRFIQLVKSFKSWPIVLSRLN